MHCNGDAGRALRRALAGVALAVAVGAAVPAGAVAVPTGVLGAGPAAKPSEPAALAAGPGTVATGPGTVAAGPGTVATGPGAGPRVPGVPESGRGGWRWPLEGAPRVVRRFDLPADPYGPGHRGVDLAAAPGATVRAAGAGVVRFAGPVGGRGVVSVTHSDGVRTTYEPVRAVVRAGDRVVAGTPLGRLEAGHLGCAQAACLHWGLIVDGVYRDPLTLLGPGAVRLYPVTT
ncbi:murein hydrolase activator EnvC family protein [Cryptosporangium aurantiacum]|nr:M23 family metallopeptidase [Cryptosporangium aurantiacum]